MVISKAVKGLCHKCLTSQVLVIDYGEEGIICQNCYGNKHSRMKSFENQPETLDDLKKAWEKNW